MESVFLDNMGYALAVCFVWMFACTVWFVGYSDAKKDIYVCAALIIIPWPVMFFIDTKEFNDARIEQLKSESECVKNELLTVGSFSYGGLREARSKCEKLEDNERKSLLLK